MVKFIVNKLRKYGLYETKFVKWLKLCALRFVGRKMKKYGLPCLEKFNSIMDEANVKYWVDFGTLLGIYRDGKFIEKVGYYDPVLASDAKNRLNLKLDRIEYWLSVGAEPTERVAIFLNKLGVKGAEKYKPVFTPKERQPKKDKKAKK